MILFYALQARVGDGSYENSTQVMYMQICNRHRSLQKSICLP